MKLDANKLKQMISEVLEEKRSESMLLEEPVSEMATGQSVADRVDPSARPDNPARTAEKFLVMSSDRGERSPQENNRVYEEFRKALESNGLQYTELVGSWVETDEESGEKRRVTEHSVIAYKDERPDRPQTDKGLFQVGMELSKKYNQEAFIFGDLEPSKATGEMQRKIRAYDAKGIEQNWGGPWSSAEAVAEDEEFWSRVRGGGKGKPFQFKEHQDYIEVEAPNSVIEAMKKANEHKGKKIRFIRRKS